MSVSTSLARPHGQPCATGCGATWKGDKAWGTCWTCPGCPLALCRPCTVEHYQSAAHLEGAAKARASMLGRES